MGEGAPEFLHEGVAERPHVVAAVAKGRQADREQV
jgi:hypothetical protein